MTGDASSARAARGDAPRAFGPAASPSANGKSRPVSGPLAIICAMTSLVLWLIRLPLYGLGAYIALSKLLPLGPFGMLLGAALAAAVIGADLAVSAKLRGRSVEETALLRVLAADRVLAKEGESLAERYQGQLEEGEVVEAEVLEGADDERRLLGR